MKLLTAALAVCFAALAASFAENAQLKHVQAVYILTMSGGMDQYLANQITRDGLFEVVTDPQKADAIITDRLGETFQKQLDDLYPPPKPVKPPKVEAAKTDAPKADAAKAEADKTADKPKTDDDASDKDHPKSDDLLSGMAATAVGLPPSTFGRGKGTIFIVDRHSRAVLWSIYERPRDMRPDTLDKTAGLIVRRLKRDLTETKPAQAQ